MNLSGVVAWFSRYSRALEGVVALLVILSFLPKSWRLVARNFGSDLDVRLDWDEGAVPPGVGEWLVRVSSSLSLLSEFEKQPPANQPYISGLDDLVALGNSPTEKLVLRRGLDPSGGRLKIRIRNNTNETVSGVRVRVANIFGFSQVALVGDFLTDREVKDFDDGADAQNGISSVVLPDLPAIPAQGVVTVSVYGDGEVADVAMSAPGRSVRIRKMTKVEDSMPVRIARDPLPTVWLVTCVLALLGPVVWVWVVQSAVEKKFPGKLYDLACEEAKAGSTDSAVVLLRKAFETGYSNKTHARTDADLSALRELPEFKSLVD